MGRETKAQKREDAIKTLRKMLSPGDTVLTVLKHVSRSGMRREISLHTVEGGDVRWLSGLAARAMGYKLGKHNGIIADGCGMDMGFHLVYSLSRTLFRDGFGCIGDRVTEYRQHSAKDCPGDHESHPECDHRESYTVRDPCQSNDHSNGDRDYAPNPHGQERCHDVPNCAVTEHWHGDGGYALRHRWL